MVGSHYFPSAFLDWLALVQTRLDAIECCAGESDGTSQSREFAGGLWRLRRECEVLHRSLDALLHSGQLSQGQCDRMRALLHDLRWLLEISPAAPPALARQCVRIAQDRIDEEVREVARQLSEAPPGRFRSFAAA